MSGKRKDMVYAWFAGKLFRIPRPDETLMVFMPDCYETRKEALAELGLNVRKRKNSRKLKSRCRTA